jgi:acyl-coenzyme A thioesterase PaaI-like protein
MDASEHFESLFRMHDSVKINEFYQPTLAVGEGEGAAEIEINLSEAFHHAAGGVHGSVYFKMLDDAAW